MKIPLAILAIFASNSQNRLLRQQIVFQLRLEPSLCVCDLANSRVYPVMENLEKSWNSIFCFAGLEKSWKLTPDCGKFIKSHGNFKRHHPLRNGVVSFFHPAFQYKDTFM